MAEHLIAKSWTSHANTTLGYVGPDGHFVAIGDIEGHGHAPEDSEVYARRLAAAWNSCKGITTERLEDLGRPLVQHLIGCDERAARMVKERDELVDALRALHRVCMAMDLEADHERPTEEAYLQATAQAAQAIAKATGQEGGA